MNRAEIIVLVLAAGVPLFAVDGSIGPEEIIRRSVQNNNADWTAAPLYDFTERDLSIKHGTRTLRTYQVTMIEGSPYHKLLAVNDQPLSPAQAEDEARKLQKETYRRRKETPSERGKRVAEYEKERHQDHSLMLEMVKAFNFKLMGESTVSGRRCFHLVADPKPNYQPSSRETKVLTGMRGEMWVDTEHYQWVKVHAEVFRPVAFGLFIANVQPGTEFTLEEAPVQGNIWLPSHFSTRVNSTVLLFSNRSTDDETYSSYRRSGGAKERGK